MPMNKTDTSCVVFELLARNTCGCFLRPPNDTYLLIFFTLIEYESIPNSFHYLQLIKAEDERTIEEEERRVLEPGSGIRTCHQLSGPER